MNRENVVEWVEALEAGDQQQGIGSLHYVDADGVDRKCCLGVASHLCWQKNLVAQENGFDGYEYDGENLMLPPAVADWLGVDSADPWLTEDDSPMHYRLSILNDRHVPFTTIAKAIRRYWLGEDVDVDQEILDSQDEFEKRVVSCSGPPHSFREFVSQNRTWMQCDTCGVTESSEDYEKKREAVLQ